MSRNPLAQGVTHKLMEQRARALGVSLQASRGPWPAPAAPLPLNSSFEPSIGSWSCCCPEAVILESPVTAGPCPPCLSEARLPVARRCLCRLLDRLWARAGPGAGLQAAPGWTVVRRRPESPGGGGAGGPRRLRESPGGGFPQKPPRAPGPAGPGGLARSLWLPRSVDPDGLEMRSSAQGVPSRAWKCFKGPGAGSGGRVT